MKLFYPVNARVQQDAINVALENLLKMDLIFKDQGFYFLYQKTELVN
jgi:hypothetical protein